MSPPDFGLSGRCLTIWHFIHARWILSRQNRRQLTIWQDRQLARFASTIMPRAPALAPYAGRPFSEWPIMNKERMLTNFAAYNTANVDLEQAMAVAMQAEQSRDFRPTVSGCSVGLSSGTSGCPGVFLVSENERACWAGILLARTMPSSLLKQVLTPWRPPVRIAFFLRANNNLYETLHGRRIQFHFHDLLQGWQAALPSLIAEPPTVLVAPASILRALADWVAAHGPVIKPRLLISVAEVLEPSDSDFIARTFNQPVRQIYQATEGFLAYTCERGQLHLNERHILIEKEWLDDVHCRFMPIITDFCRTTQLIVRYRLNDVLRLAAQPCNCGAPDTTLAAIEGRTDEVLTLADHHSRWQPVYPELLRRAMMLATPAPHDYHISQQADSWHIQLVSPDPSVCQQGVEQAIAQLCQEQGWRTPVIRWMPWTPPPPGSKRRRIVCRQRPAGGC